MGSIKLICTNAEGDVLKEQEFERAHAESILQYQENIPVTLKIYWVLEPESKYTYANGEIRTERSTEASQEPAE